MWILWYLEALGGVTQQLSPGVQPHVDVCKGTGGGLRETPAPDAEQHGLGTSWKKAPFPVSVAPRALWLHSENRAFCFQMCPVKSKNVENLTMNEESEKSAGSSSSGWEIALE